jgi:hypothetical protein
MMLTLGLFLLATVYQAQDETQTSDNPVIEVAFVEGRRELDTASITNIGPSGTLLLKGEFEKLGANVRLIDLDDGIPDDIDIVVIIQPNRPLNTLYVTFLWGFLLRGGHLLLAIDPNDYNDISTEVVRTSGFNRLLQQEFGIGLNEGFLAESWFSNFSVAYVEASRAPAYADAFLPHPVTEPLVKYQLPIFFSAASG